MWREDYTGIEFPTQQSALEHLSAQATQLIAAGDKQGRDVRAVRVRVRDDADGILFEGTLGEASALNGSPQSTRMTGVDGHAKEVA
jgi:hypothetical protein